MRIILNYQRNLIYSAVIIWITVYPAGITLDNSLAFLYTVSILNERKLNK